MILAQIFVFCNLWVNNENESVVNSHFRLSMLFFVKFQCIAELTLMDGVLESVARSEVESFVFTPKIFFLLIGTDWYEAGRQQLMLVFYLQMRGVQAQQ